MTDGAYREPQASSNGVTKIWVHLAYCYDARHCAELVLLEALDLETDTRWSYLHSNYVDACLPNVLA